MRNSVKLFSLLLALAIVFSAVPATEAKAEEPAIGAPRELKWGVDGSVSWQPPENLPDLQEYAYVYYEVKLYTAGADDAPMGSIRVTYQSDFTSNSYTGFIDSIVSGGTFYFTVQLFATKFGDEAQQLTGVLAKSGEKTIDPSKKLPTPSWENNEITTFISKEIDFNTLEVTEDLELCFEDCKNDKVGQVKIEWCYSDTELSEEEFANHGHLSMHFDRTHTWTSLLKSHGYSLDNPPYIYIRYRYLPKTEADVASDWSEIKLYNDESVQKNIYTLPTVSHDTIKMLEDGTITWEAPTNLSAADDRSTLSYQLTLCKKLGEAVTVEQDTIFIRDRGEDRDITLASDIFKKAFTGDGEYVLFIRLAASKEIPVPPHISLDYIYGDYVKYVISVPEDVTNKLPAPEDLTRTLSNTGNSDWSEVISWPYEDEKVNEFEFEVCFKQSNDQWLPFMTGNTSSTTYTIYLACDRLWEETKLRIRALSKDISQVLSSEWTEVELSTLPITLTENLFSVNTDDVEYDGSAKTKEIIPAVIPNHQLVQDTDYTVAYANNTEVGTATITITGIGKYTGELTYSFAITEAPSGGGSAESGDVPGGDIYDDLYTPSIPSDVTQSTTNADGSVTQTTTRADGTTTETTTTADGVVGTVERSSSGEITSAQVTISERADGGIVTAPVEVAPSADSESAPEISVKTPAGSGAKVEIPVTNAGPGTVAVKVNPDGTEEVIRDCVGGKNGVIFSTEGDITVKIVERGSAFTDVTGASAWASDAVEFVAARELFNGTGSNHFTPTGNMSRGMMVTVLYRLAYEPESTDAAFGDVGNDQFYSEAVAWAADRNVANGYNASTFGPDDDVTREQMVTMLYRYAKSSGWDVTTAQSALSGFADANAVHDFAKDAMAWAVEAGIILGNGDGNLSPEGHATRAEAATIMMRFCQNVIFGTATAKNA